jgi:hypothetical protein
VLVALEVTKVVILNSVRFWLVVAVEVVTFNLITLVTEMVELPTNLVVEVEVLLGQLILLVQVVLVLNVKAVLAVFEALLVGEAQAEELLVMLVQDRELKIQS